MGGTIIAQTVEEQRDGVVLEYPGFYTESLKPVAGGESFRSVARIDPFGNVRDNYRYKLYYSSIRGEVYTYNPQIKTLYAAYTEWMKAGKPENPRPEVLLTNETEDAITSDQAGA